MWYYERNGAQLGPVAAAEIQQRLDSGELSNTTLVWRDGMESWTELGRVPELLPGGGANMMLPQSHSGQAFQHGMQQPQTNAMAITSMVLGIVSIMATFICFFGIIFAVPGVICGHLSLSQIKNAIVIQTGRGMAIAGLVTGYLVILGTISVGIFFGVMFAGVAKTASSISVPPSSSSPTFAPTPSPSITQPPDVFIDPEEPELTEE